MLEKQQALLREAYTIIGGLTPLTEDCGIICGAACCNSGEGVDEMGMLLFPGEAETLSGTPGFKVWRIKYMGIRANLLTCTGGCERSLRPLSCRVFPLAPHIGADGEVSATADLRGRGMCPLWRGELLDSRFKEAVGSVFALLSSESDALRLMKAISDEIDSLKNGALEGL